MSGMVGRSLCWGSPLLSAISSQVQEKSFLSRVSNPVFFSKRPSLPDSAWGGVLPSVCCPHCSHSVGKGTPTYKESDLRKACDTSSTSRLPDQRQRDSNQRASEHKPSLHPSHLPTSKHGDHREQPVHPWDARSSGTVIKK